MGFRIQGMHKSHLSVARMLPQPFLASLHVFTIATLHQRKWEHSDCQTNREIKMMIEGVVDVDAHS